MSSPNKSKVDINYPILSLTLFMAQLKHDGQLKTFLTNKFAIFSNNCFEEEKNYSLVYIHMPTFQFAVGVFIIG